VRRAGGRCGPQGQPLPGVALGDWRGVLARAGMVADSQRESLVRYFGSGAPKGRGGWQASRGLPQGLGRAVGLLLARIRTGRGCLSKTIAISITC
jgi:hypothetical protein